jgi:hypothetical protein
MYGFESADGGFAPLARAIQDGSIGSAFEDGNLMRVGMKLEESAGPLYDGTIGAIVEQTVLWRARGLLP